MSYLDKHTFIMTWKTWFEFHIAVFSRVLCKSVQHRVYQPLACNSSFNRSPIPYGKVPHVRSCLDPSTSSANSHSLASPLAEKYAEGHHVFPVKGQILERGHLGRNFKGMVSGHLGTSPWPHGFLIPSYDQVLLESSSEQSTQDISWIQLDCLAISITLLVSW